MERGNREVSDDEARAILRAIDDEATDARIAKALLVKSMKMFRDMGFDHTALGVDTANQTGALQLYESVGYKTVRTETFYRKGM